jgi:D-alanyl-D-alanine carboxypeptidase/D-alanyl-D-alanine-endopeptidase (penicillin-binding protein 4)
MRLLFICLLISSNLLAQNKVQKAINSFAEYPDMKYSSVSFYALDIDKNEVLASHNPNLSLITASTMKAITTATILAVLGKDYKFETAIEYDGNIEDGVLNGNLYFKGYGDPSLGSPFMEEASKLNTLSLEFANALKKAGIKSIKGNVIGDGSHFEYSSLVPSWQWMDMGNHYGAGVMGLNLHDNLYYINFQQVPTLGAQPKIKSVVPEQRHIKFYNEVSSANWNSGDNSFIYAAPYATEAWIKGTLPAGSGIFSIMGAVTDPEFFAADWLLHSLEDNGISISGKPIAQRIQKSTASRKKIHSHYSPVLSDLIRHTNEISRNMYCEAYVKAIGKKLKNDGSLDAGVAAISEFWRSRGIETSGMYMEDGSGLSARNNVSAKIMTEIMRKVHIDNNTFPNFKKLLSIAGKTGTYRYSGKGTLLEGNLHAKGGSMSRVRSITGYITTKSKRNVAFTIIVNNFNCSGAMLKQRMESLMLAIAGMDY